MALEIVIAIVAAAALAVAYWMFWTGLAATAGLVLLKRCHSCGHLTPTRPGRSVETCAICRHPSLRSHLPHRRLRHYLPAEW